MPTPLPTASAPKAGRPPSATAFRTTRPRDDLPATLAPYFDTGAKTLVVPADDPTGPLRDLLGWTDRHHLDLSGLEIGPPSLEDAYLAAIGQPTSAGTLP